MIIILIMGICAVLSLILGLFIRSGKGLMLIAGYNTTPKEERDKIDKKELSKVAGNLILRLALVFALLGITLYFNIIWATAALFIIILIDTCVTAVKLSRKGTRTKASKRGMMAAVAITTVILIAVGVMFIYGERDPAVSIQDNQIQIKAMYGLDINFSSVKNISLIEQSMDDIAQKMHRDNGYGGFGGTLKGHFSAQNLGKFTLFVKLDSSPTIWIERNEGEDIYISLSGREKTEALFHVLEASIRLR